MSSSLIVLCPNGRRVNVKISNNSPLLNALKQACEKQGFNVENYELRRGKTVIDLSQPFRFSGLTNNAKLEMVQATTPRHTDGEVCVSVQTESGDRVQGTFISSTSLWDVLDKLDLTSSINEDTPCVVYMRQQVSGEKALSTTSLKSMGMSSGRVSIRFTIMKPVGVPGGDNEPMIVEAVQQNTQPAKETDIESTNDQDKQSRTSHVDEQISSDETMKDKMEVVQSSKAKEIHKHDDDDEVKSKPVGNHGNIEFPVLPFSVFPTDDPNDDSKSMETDMPTNQANEMDLTGALEQHPLEEQSHQPFIIEEGSAADYYGKMIMSQIMERQKSQEPVYEEPCERNPVIFSLNDSMSVPIADVSDDFFEPTIADVQKMQQDLQKNVKQLADAPLLTQELRNTKRRCTYRQTVIRVIMPDRMVLQGTFNTGESLKSLVKFVREHLEDDKKKFILYTTPPKEILKSARPTFNDKGFYPATNIYLSVTEANEGGVVELCNRSLLSDTSISRYRKELIQAEELASKLRPLQNNSISESESSTDQVIVSKNKIGNRPNPQSSNKSKEVSSSKTTKNVPKWFNVGRK